MVNRRRRRRRGREHHAGLRDEVAGGHADRDAEGVAHKDAKAGQVDGAFEGGLVDVPAEPERRMKALVPENIHKTKKYKIMSGNFTVIPTLNCKLIQTN